MSHSWQELSCQEFPSKQELRYYEHLPSASHHAVYTFSHLILFSPYKWLSKWHSGKECACDAGDSGSIPGSGRSLGGGNVSPRQYSCLESPMDRGAW